VIVSSWVAYTQGENSGLGRGGLGRLINVRVLRCEDFECLATLRDFGLKIAW